jgi:hypothetical protein
VTADLVARTQKFLARYQHLEGWTVRIVPRFDNPEWRGYCWHARKEILLTPMATWSDCLHEVAHIFEPDDEKHGERWRQCWSDLWFEFGNWTGEPEGREKAGEHQHQPTNTPGHI